MPPRFSFPRELFATTVTDNSNIRNRYDASRAGQRFLIATAGSDAAVGATSAVLDWLGRLEKR